MSVMNIMHQINSFLLLCSPPAISCKKIRLIGPSPCLVFPCGFFDGASSKNLDGVGICLYLNVSRHFEFVLGVGDSTNSKAELLGLWALLKISHMMGIPYQLFWFFAWGAYSLFFIIVCTWGIGSGSLSLLLWSLWLTIDMIYLTDPLYDETDDWWDHLQLFPLVAYDCEVTLQVYTCTLHLIVTHYMGRHFWCPLILNRISRTCFFLPEKKVTKHKNKK